MDKVIFVYIKSSQFFKLYKLQDIKKSIKTPTFMELNENNTFTVATKVMTFQLMFTVEDGYVN